MNPVARPWIGLVVKCLAALALVFAFVFFMRMQEEQSDVERYRSEGTLSRAEVTGRVTDQMVYSGRAGRSRSEDLQVLQVRFVPESPVRYADFPGTASLDDLPLPPAPSGDPLADSQFSDVIFVTRAVFDATQVGDVLTVVDTRYSGDGPEFYDDIRDFDPATYYPRIAIALLLGLAFAILAWRIGKAPVASGAARAAPLPPLVP
ncbi:MAG: hypothetical protein KDE15_02910 [Erythrobacter sp.]|nr:hypothetical protein [Erythrobacter sp.]